MGDALARDLEVEVDSGNEVENDEFTEEELKELLQEGIEDETEKVDQSPELDKCVWEEDYDSFCGQRDEFRELDGPKVQSICSFKFGTSLSCPL